MSKNRSSRRRRTNRKGSLVAEFAVCLPILILFFFGLWEYSRMEIVRQTVKAAAFEGARQGIVDGATEGEMQQTAQQWLDAFAIRDAAITTTLTNEESEVFITVPLLSNSFSATIFGRNAEVASRIELVREAVGG